MTKEQYKVCYPTSSRFRQLLLTQVIQVENLLQAYFRGKTNSYRWVLLNHNFYCAKKQIKKMVQNNKIELKQCVSWWEGLHVRHFILLTYSAPPPNLFYKERRWIKSSCYRCTSNVPRLRVIQPPDNTELLQL